jgi:hypothetical protein
MLWGTVAGTKRARAAVLRAHPTLCRHPTRLMHRLSTELTHVAPSLRSLAKRVHVSSTFSRTTCSARSSVSRRRTVRRACGQRSSTCSTSSSPSSTKSFSSTTPYVSSLTRCRPFKELGPTDRLPLPSRLGSSSDEPEELLDGQARVVGAAAVGGAGKGLASDYEKDREFRLAIVSQTRSGLRRLTYLTRSPQSSSSCACSASGSGPIRRCS